MLISDDNKFIRLFKNGGNTDKGNLGHNHRREILKAPRKTNNEN